MSKSLLCVLSKVCLKALLESVFEISGLPLAQPIHSLECTWERSNGCSKIRRLLYPSDSKIVVEFFVCLILAMCLYLNMQPLFVFLEYYRNQSKVGGCLFAYSFYFGFAFIHTGSLNLASWTNVGDGIKSHGQHVSILFEFT